MRTLFKQALVVNEGTVTEADVLVNAGVIEAVGTNLAVPAGAVETVHAKGK